jgi:deoxyribodipyrimidine photolyase-related protein
MLTDHRFLCHSVVSAYLNAGCSIRWRCACGGGRMARGPCADQQRGRVHSPDHLARICARRLLVAMPDGAGQCAGCAPPLPWMYWSGETPMACMRAAITQTREEAYAHHIQRLMVTGNFALLAGADPHALHEWYLAVYADAYEWVELPNTGMSQFADGAAGLQTLCGQRRLYRADERLLRRLRL